MAGGAAALRQAPILRVERRHFTPVGKRERIAPAPRRAIPAAFPATFTAPPATAVAERGAPLSSQADGRGGRG